VTVHLSKALFPPESVIFLGVLAQIGVIFFLFLVGLELDPKLLRNKGHAAVVISHASIVVPFLLGAGLALYLYPRLFNDTPAMRFTPVALFMGAAMSITAFPVLARILTERNLHKTRIGAVAITCAAVDDVTGLVHAGVRRRRRPGRGDLAALWTAGLSAVTSSACSSSSARSSPPAAGRVRPPGPAEPGGDAPLVLGWSCSAPWTTEKIGIHALIGAFMVGR
jgi:Kef-type K+ transport system membrane component KefB